MFLLPLPVVDTCTCKTPSAAACSWHVHIQDTDTGKSQQQLLPQLQLSTGVQLVCCWHTLAELKSCLKIASGLQS